MKTQFLVLVALFIPSGLLPAQQANETFPKRRPFRLLCTSQTSQDDFGKFSKFVFTPYSETVSFVQLSFPEGKEQRVETELPGFSLLRIPNLERGRGKKRKKKTQSYYGGTWEISGKAVAASWPSEDTQLNLERVNEKSWKGELILEEDFPFEVTCNAVDLDAFTAEAGSFDACLTVAVDAALLRYEQVRKGSDQENVTAEYRYGRRSGRKAYEIALSAEGREAASDVYQVLTKQVFDAGLCNVTEIETKQSAFEKIKPVK